MYVHFEFGLSYQLHAYFKTNFHCWTLHSVSMRWLELKWFFCIIVKTSSENRPDHSGIQAVKKKAQTKTTTWLPQCWTASGQLATGP